MLKIRSKRNYILFFVIFLIATPYLSYRAEGTTPPENEKVAERYYFTEGMAGVTDQIKKGQTSSQKPLELTPTNSERIELEYKFLGPKIKEADEEYYSIEIMDTFRFCDEPGLPLLPVKTAKILIPQGRVIKNITVIPGRKITLDGEYKIEYSKQQIPISRPDLMVETEPKEEIYSSSDPFPGKFYSEVTTQFLKGYKILIVNLYPVQYIPAHDKLSYYPNMRLKVITVPSGPSYARKAPCRKLPKDISHVKKLIDNPSILNSYSEEPSGIGGTGFFEGTTEATTSSLTPADYEYVIITTEALESTFQTLADHKALKGITSKVVTVEWIYATYLGTRPDGGSDNQTRIRNFISDAYFNWGTDYVLLGGDGDGDGGAIIPHRGVYGRVPQQGPDIIDNDIPSDLYYGALDGTWDYDADGIYGEDDDGDLGGEVDLLAEVYIGRVPCDTIAEAINQIGKIIAYEQSTPGNSALLIGEQMDAYTWGGDYKDEAYLYFPGVWTRQMLYDRDATFSTTAVINEMNSNQHHIINHQGHANNTYNMGLVNADVDGLINTTYFLAYSQGCYCNAFDNRTDEVASYTVDDAISEHFTAENNTAAFAYIGSTRYGWYITGSTNGASQQFDKEFFDAIFNEGKTKLGIAFTDSKEDLIGSVGSIGAIRWCYFQLCLMGDPETPVALPQPDLTLSGSTDISFSNPSPEAGETITISAEIFNDGADYKDLFDSYAENGFTNNMIVDEGAWPAQPFNVSSTLALHKISIYIRDAGIDDSMTVEIRTDVSGIPGNLLAFKTINADDSYAWVDFVFDLPVILNPGNYWICGVNYAAPIEVGTNGYAWKMDQGVGSIAVSFNQGSTWNVGGYLYTPYFELYRATEVKFYDGDPDYGANLIGLDYLSPISAVGSDVASIQWTPVVSGSHNIWVVVDPDDFITESNETNNKDYKSITVVTELSVSVSPDSWHMGIVEAGSVTTMTAPEKITVENTGTDPATFTLQITDSGGSWSAATTENGNTLQNTFVMGGVFAALGDTIGAGDFNQGTDDDVLISASPKTASATIFCSSSSSADGVDVHASGQRALWLQFKSPPSTTTYVQQAIVITVGAQAVLP